jgi:hypothetical protein
MLRQHQGLVKIGGGRLARRSTEDCRELRTVEQGFLHVEPAVRNVWRNLPAGCFYARAVDVRFLFAGYVTAARSTASEPARRKPAATDKGKLGDAIRPLPVVVPCILNEIVATVPDSSNA